MTNQKGFSSILIIIGLVVLVGIISGVYYLTTQKNKSDTTFQNNSYLSTETSISPSNNDQTIDTAPQTIPPEIILTPKRKNALKYSVKGPNDCGIPEGAVGYFEEPYNGGMTIVSSKLNRNEDSIKGLKKLDNEFNLELTKQQEYTSTDQAFTGFCGGGGITTIREFSNMKYKGMDKSKVIMTTIAQSMFPSVFVNVYGKKGDNYVLLSNRVLYAETKGEQIIKDCESKSNQLEVQAECYSKAIIEDKQIEQAAIDEAYRLMTLYEIE